MNNTTLTLKMKRAISELRSGGKVVISDNSLGTSVLLMSAELIEKESVYKLSDLAFSRPNIILSNNRCNAIGIDVSNQPCSILIENKSIQLFPENDILPYDHFSIPEEITKQRFQLINNRNKEKHILISSVRNLFELFPNRYFFKSEETFSINDKLSIDSIIKIVESLNYQKKTNVENINEYSIPASE